MQLLYAAGRLVTRALLSPRVRQYRWARCCYACLYLFGKSIAERREVRFFRTHLTRGMVVIDVGAHVGFYTRLFSALVGGEGEVHAFEPDPLSCGILRDRIRSSPHSNVRVVQSAVGDRAGVATLHYSCSNRADARLYPHRSGATAERVDVPLTTLDAYCADREVRRVDAVKVDVQGAEAAVLRGMQHLLAVRQPRWVFLELFPEGLRGASSTPVTFDLLLRDHGYHLHALHRGGELRPITDIGRFAQQYDRSHTNVVALRTDASALSRESSVRAHFDREAARYDEWKRRNWYYYDAIKRHYRERVPPSSSVLEVGCGTGDILVSVAPHHGVGVDISPEMVAVARRKYPQHVWHAGTLAEVGGVVREQFDYVILSDVVEHLEDVPGTFRELRHFCHPRTAVLVNMANPYWEPLLMVLEWLRLKMPEGPHRRISVRTLNTLLEREGFILRSHRGAVLCPSHIPILSSLLERIEHTSVVRGVCLIQFLEYGVSPDSLGGGREEARP